MFYTPPHQHGGWLVRTPGGSIGSRDGYSRQYPIMLRLLKQWGGSKVNYM